MQCPSCANKATKVLDSRLSEQDNTVRRRRECEKCRFRFSTREETEILNLTVIKRDGRREAYSREKLSSGLSKALQKRPITSYEFRVLISGIERDISVINRTEIKGSQIGDIAMRRLKKLDKVAYIRFASVYREFKDIETFYEEINKLEGKRKKLAANSRASRAGSKGKTSQNRFAKSKNKKQKYAKLKKRSKR